MRNASNFIQLKKPPVKKQQGFTMLEALLTLFVLTIGVLGVAGLQMRAMSSGGMAMQRTVVLMKTQELLERMRANKANLISYAGAGAGTNGGCSDGGGGGAVACAGAAMASHDLFQWRSDLAALLSASALGATPITVNLGALIPNTTPSKRSPSTIQITVNWTSKTNNQGAVTQAQSYAVTTQI